MNKIDRVRAAADDWAAGVNEHTRLESLTADDVVAAFHRRAAIECATEAGKRNGYAQALSEFCSWVGLPADSSDTVVAARIKDLTKGIAR